MSDDKHPKEWIFPEIPHPDVTAGVPTDALRWLAEAGIGIGILERAIDMVVAEAEPKRNGRVLYLKIDTEPNTFHNATHPYHTHLVALCDDAPVSNVVSLDAFQFFALSYYKEHLDAERAQDGQDGRPFKHPEM